MDLGKCDVCRTRDAAAVASSSLGPVSWAYCMPCARKPAEPEVMFAATIDSCGSDVANWVKQLFTYKDGAYVSFDDYAQGMAARSDETPQVAQPVGQQPGSQDAPEQDQSQ